MPLSALDTNIALIVVDLQMGILAYPTAQPVGEVVARAAALAKAFRAHGLPVVLVNVAGVAPGRTDAARRIGEIPPEMMVFAPELDQQPSDHVVTKRTWGAFTDTDLAAYLKAREVTQVVVCGVATSAGVESTARHAHELGLNVTVAIDAMTDMSAEAHDNSIARIFPRMAETATTEEILALLG